MKPPNKDLLTVTLNYDDQEEDKGTENMKNLVTLNKSGMEFLS